MDSEHTHKLPAWRFSQVAFYFPQWASLWAKSAFFLCGTPYSAAVIPHFHVRGRENIIFVVITLRANQTDHFSISDGYMTTNRKLGFLQLGWIYPVFVYISLNDIYSFFTYVEEVWICWWLLCRWELIQLNFTDGRQFIGTWKQDCTERELCPVWNDVTNITAVRAYSVLQY